MYTVYKFPPFTIQKVNPNSTLNMLCLSFDNYEDAFLYRFEQINDSMKNRYNMDLFKFYTFSNSFSTLDYRKVNKLEERDYFCLFSPFKYKKGSLKKDGKNFYLNIDGKDFLFKRVDIDKLFYSEDDIIKKSIEMVIIELYEHFRVFSIFDLINEYKKIKTEYPEKFL